jgi:hypothetical protein
MDVSILYPLSIKKDMSSGSSSTVKNWCGDNGLHTTKMQGGLNAFELAQPQLSEKTSNRDKRGERTRFTICCKGPGPDGNLLIRIIFL